MKNNKSFNIRLSKELWAFLKTRSIKEETSMNELIIQWLERLKKKDEKKD